MLALVYCFLAITFHVYYHHHYYYYNTFDSDPEKFFRCLYPHLRYGDIDRANISVSTFVCTMTENRSHISEKLDQA